MKMRKIAITITACVLLVLTAPVTVRAQEEHEAPAMYVYATYFECDVAHQWLADMIMDDLFAPAWDAAVEAGTVSSWGWMAHDTGGPWRRVLYHTSPDIGSLLAASDMVNGPIRASDPGPAHGFTEVCGRHDDYIWKYVTGSRGSEAVRQRGEAGFSVYMECDMGREGRADELVKSAFAPVYDRHVANGDLASWGWLEHWVGGQWRRLLTMSAKDHESLLAVRGVMMDEAFTEHEAEATEFDSICNQHQDYMWDIVHESP